MARKSIGSSSDTELRTLHPAVRERAAHHLEMVRRAGYEIARIVAWESVEDRERLWRVGRRRINGHWEVKNRAIVASNSRIGWHPFGLCYELQLVAGGRPVVSTLAWKQIALMAERCGLQTYLTKGGTRQWLRANEYQLVPSDLRPSRALVTYRKYRSLIKLWEHLSAKYPELR